MRIDAILIHERDNVAVALRDIAEKEEIVVGKENGSFRMRVSEAIPFGHKFAVRYLEKDETIIKYGEIIGRTTSAIPLGAHAHIHNIESLRGRGDLKDN
jgi:altronate dehydratase small subunit